MNNFGYKWLGGGNIASRGNRQGLAKSHWTEDAQRNQQQNRDAMHESQLIEDGNCRRMWECG